MIFWDRCCQQSCGGWSRRRSGGPCIRKDLERCLNMLRMNLSPLLFHEAFLFQAFGGLSVSARALLSLLLDALPVLSAHKSRLFLPCGGTLSEGIRTGERGDSCEPRE